MSWTEGGTPQASDARDALALAFERRFPDTLRPATATDELTDNNGIFIGTDTQDFAKDLGFIPCHSPAYSPENYAMSEALVKRFQQDNVYAIELWSAEEILERLAF